MHDELARLAAAADALTTGERQQLLAMLERTGRYHGDEDHDGIARWMQANADVLRTAEERHTATLAALEAALADTTEERR
jgi:hypothetical protein